MAKKKSLSVLKRIRQNRKRYLRNKARKEKLKEAIKELKRIPNKEEALKLFPKVQSIIDKAVKWGIIHKNKAARIKSKLAEYIASLS
ncbi:MAG: 30S ribosomal protein S20 [candidate division WOR-3 bacterium]|nr:30S ribosomal protein S20 [candidate division WOR-3 bacterium]MCX7837247.1 30S ribosomal protein S20 [candidate division WOR-3 bacterium]MDW8113498.1 30S ribosomal protein S20 [candidate division WOR-3 bacterium]